ncbi:MAG: transcriptional regulator [Firmicutes bacterium]|nr:transcriptional regulator [Bacillota bacterium]
MKLSKSIAQKIVEEMMKVVPYNINVMDEKGIIIGSGEVNRIGDVHEGARKAVEDCLLNEIYQEGAGVKPGVNEPIIFEGNVIGVIGITGDPDEVRRFSKLVRVTAVLLIEQAKVNEQDQNKRLNMQKFYYELAYRRSEYDGIFYRRAHSYGLNITKECQVVLVEGNANSKSFKGICQRYSHYYTMDNRMVFFIASKQIVNALLKELESSPDLNKVSVGQVGNNFAIALEKAKMAMNVGLRIKPSVRIYYYDELQFFIHLSHENMELLSSLFFKLNQTGNQQVFIQTLQAYIEENGDINSVADRLMIHRNTLNYRLERIQQLTGKNPKVLLELFELLGALLWGKESKDSDVEGESN